MKPAYNLQLFKDGAPGEYVNPNYLQLFTLENEKCSEVIFSLQYGGPNIGQGEEFVKIFGNRSVLNGWANMQPTNYLVNLYQSTKTGDYVDPIILSKTRIWQMDQLILKHMKDVITGCVVLLYGTGRRCVQSLLTE